MTRTLIGTALSVLLVGACAANGDLYTSIDEDADGLVDRNEFYAGSAEFGSFDDWDTDYDGYLDDDEFYYGMEDVGLDTSIGYDSWDRDGDGLLTDQEMYYGTFDELDADEDGFLDRNEFEFGIRAPLP